MPVVTGNWAVEMRPSFTFIGPHTISATVTVLPSTRYVLSAYFHTERFQGTQLFYVDLDDAPFETEITATNTALGWQLVSATIDVPADVTSVTVRVVHDNQSALESGYADDIALTPEAPSTPSPMCM